jgi:alkyl sulfatase BDS1-like metallo-beta-lactamase superfamily hydrolase
MGNLRDLSAKLLAGQASTVEQHPFAPLFLVEEVAARTAFVSSFANVTALDTDEGLVLVDTGSFVLAGPTKALVRTFSQRPLHTAVFTHGHVDHCFGVDLYEAEGGKARVVAHERVPARFDRYKMTRGYNACINARQFQLSHEWPANYRYPDVTYSSELSIEIGGRVLEIHHALGETDDHSWLWLPGERVLCTGDLFIWAAPNAGNPQKVQRYPREWAAALRAMIPLGAEVLCPGHGPPIFGAEIVKTALSETAELLESLVEQTLAQLNAGARLDTILQEVRAPQRLLERPYLRPIYDEPEFIVRNLVRLYGGWYDGNPAHLKPGSERALSRELADLAGGAHKLADRATALAAKGEYAVACHLVETASLAAPGDEGIWKARAEIYRKRAEVESSLMAKGVYGSASREEMKGG